jgi:hypothetical protein
MQLVYIYFGEMRIKFWLGNLKGRDHLRDLVVDGKITLERVSPCPAQGLVERTSEHGNEHSGSIKGGEIS